MRSRRRARLASRVAAAVLLGTATIFVPKADPAEHWATPPRHVVEVQAEQAPDPDEPLRPGPFPPPASPPDGDALPVPGLPV